MKSDILPNFQHFSLLQRCGETAHLLGIVFISDTVIFLPFDAAICMQFCLYKNYEVLLKSTSQQESECSFCNQCDQAEDQGARHIYESA